MLRPLLSIALPLWLTVNSICSAQVCNGILPSCAVGYCSTTYQLGRSCLSSIPFNNAWRLSILNTINLALENYGLRYITQNSGPPYYLQSNGLALLNSTLYSNDYTSDWAFQEDVQQALASLHDAHTRYSKPLCYDAVQTVPFGFNISYVPNKDSDSPQPTFNVHLMKSLYFNSYLSLYPTLSDKVLLAIDPQTQVTSIDGLETITAISNWANVYETRSNDPAIRFNAAVTSFLYRSQRSTVLSSSPTITFSLKLANGTETDISFPWLISYSNNFGDVNKCTNTLTQSELPAKESRPSKTSVESHPPLIASLLDRPSAHSVSNSEHNSLMIGERKTIIAPGASNTSISCFIQGAQNGKNVLMMKVGSFSPPGQYLDAWNNFIADAITCLGHTAPVPDALVVDVMGNGGGYVCLGLRLLTLIFNDFNLNHTKTLMTYDLPHSNLMDQYIQNYNFPTPYINPQDVEAILNPATMLPFVDGKAYYYPGRLRRQGGFVFRVTNPFVLDCREAFAISPKFTPPKTFSANKLAITILTDGTCGSTCAAFTKIAQEAGVGTFVGVGGFPNFPMDIASFAGGFVCNAGYLATMSKLANASAFPQFLTNNAWQFDWAVSYSKRDPDRPIQFTQQTADERIPFWTFPSALIDPVISTQAVSNLYDEVIRNTVDRVQAASSECSDSSTLRIIAIIFPILFCVTVIFLLYRKFSGINQNVPDTSYAAVN